MSPLDRLKEWSALALFVVLMHFCITFFTCFMIASMQNNSRAIPEPFLIVLDKAIRDTQEVYLRYLD